MRKRFIHNYKSIPNCEKHLNVKMSATSHKALLSKTYRGCGHIQLLMQFCLSGQTVIAKATDTDLPSGLCLRRA